MLSVKFMLKKLVVVIKALFVAYILAGITLWFLSPWLVSHFASPVLLEKNLTLSDDTRIRYNPFISNVTISDLKLYTSLQGEQKTALSLKKANVELSFWRLLVNELHVSEINVDELIVNVDKSASRLIIAGWPINENKDNSSPDPETENNDENYQLFSPEIRIKNSAVNLNWLGHRHQLSLSSIQINQLLLSALQQQGEFSLALLLNDNKITLNTEVELKAFVGQVESTLSVTSLDLSRFDHVIFPQQSKVNELKSGRLSVEANQKIFLTKDSLITELTDLSLKLEDLLILADNTYADVAEQHFISDKFIVNVEQWQQETPITSIKGLASFNLNALNIYHEKESLSLSNVASVSIPEISVQTLDKINHIEIPTVQIKDVHFSDNQGDEIPSIARFKMMEILDIHASALGLKMSEIDFSGLGADINIAKDKKIVGLIQPPTKNIDLQAVESKENDEKVEQIAQGLNEEVEKNSQNKAFPFAIDKIKLVEVANIHFADESVTPKYTRSFAINTLTFGPLDNQKPDQLSVLSIKGTSNQYAHFDVKADAKPFAAVPYYQLNGFLKEVSLPAISTYIKDALQYEFDSGQLDLNIDVVVDKDDINGNANVLIRGLELGAADNPHDKTLTTSTSMPLNYALGMLKDGDGNVELDIPLKGKTSAPDFSTSGFLTLIIKQATTAAAKDYLLTTFVPYANVIKLGMSAGEYLMKVNFNDLPFEAGSTELSESHTNFLQQFSALMKDKSETDITVCAYAIPADIKLKPVNKDLTASQLLALNEVSLARMQSFKKYMVEEHNIASSRLLLCSPKVDTDEKAKARLTFTD